ncbi:hypothetical protein JRQ81_000513 [Phrynocephalus forsythii]|uniref:Uncharacterized protein n=1 Tax=Phrynocephalus forsythii TaxID=171643 RepID=A0A9Q0Y9C3_9SAUR|nr:hypothetical protein JRQ81_000513 [Phrynocephalus forsythii]
MQRAPYAWESPQQPRQPLPPLPSSSPGHRGKWVQLNVGSTIFLTTQQKSFLCRLCQSKDSSRTADNNYTCIILMKEEREKDSETWTEKYKSQH